MTTATTEDALNLLRYSQDRILEREGIPMVLALVSEVGAPVPPASSDADATELANTLSELRSRLAPTARDNDMGQVINVLQAAAYASFGPGGQPL